MGERLPDFTGWASKNDLQCSDGRTIRAGAFKHQDKTRVPLVWSHDHKDPSNVLGHAVLEDRAFGVYTEGFFNNSSRALDAKEAVKHGDINALSIYANKLKQRGGDVLHGNIVEVSLVLAGANPGAYIENVSISHGDERHDLEGEAIIYTGLTLEHQDNSEGGTVAQETETQNNSTSSEKTVQEIFDELTEEQKNVVYFMIGEAIKEAGGDDNDDDDDDSDDVEHGSITTEDFLAHINDSIQKGIEEMASRNTFAEYGDTQTSNKPHLSHAQFSEIVSKARSSRAESLMDELKHGAADVLQHDGVAGVDYGVADIDFLFPDAKAISSTPDFIKRRTEWVNYVLTKTKHIPFAKVKTVHADITEPEARAKGYIKGNLKKEEVFKLLKRTTSPATIYKKQKLDRDDILDITDFDVVVWLQAEIRLMLEEEIARAILVGDNRAFDDEDKIKDPEGAIQGEGIRSILHDSDLYAIKVQLPSNVAPNDMVKGVIRARTGWRGTGRPAMFISDDILTDIMLEEDRFERPKYETEQALADKLRVSDIVPVEVFNEYEELVAIIVNLQDYSVGTNKGGEITKFEDFDIDFNQHKYLQETRLSGGLTKPFSAIVVTRALGTQATPTSPDFDGDLNVITIPTVTGVEYVIDGDVVTGDVEIDVTTEVQARPAEGYFFAPNTVRSWTFTYTPNAG